MLAASRLIPLNDTAVVVAQRDIDAGEALTARDVEVANYPKSLVPSGSLPNTKAAIGALPRADLTAGTPLTASMLRSAQAVPDGPSHVAFPLHVADEQAAALLHPGDHIMVFKRATDFGKSEVAADDVVVLSIDGSGPAGPAAHDALITVDVRKDTARRLAGGDSDYTFALLGG